MSRSLLVLVLALAVAYAAPATEEETELETQTEGAKERFANLSSLTLPSATDLGFSGSSLMQILVSGGAVVLALVGLFSVIALIMPLFGFKQLCYLMGTCGDNGVGPNSGYMAGSTLANGVAQAYDAYHTYNQPASAYTASPTYQKRSLEYFGPILKALNKAYEKYETFVAPTPVNKE